MSGPTRAGAPRFLAARRPRCSRRREYRKHVTNAQERNAVLAQRSFGATKRTRRAGDPPVRALSPLEIADRPAWCRIAAPAGWRDRLPAARHPSTPPWPPAQPAPNARRAVPRPVAAAAPAEAELPAAARRLRRRASASASTSASTNRCTLGTTRPSAVRFRWAPPQGGASAIPTIAPGEHHASRRPVRQRRRLRGGASAARGRRRRAAGRRRRRAPRQAPRPVRSRPRAADAPRLLARPAPDPHPCALASLPRPLPPRAPTSSPVRHPAADLAPTVPPRRRHATRAAA